MYQTEDDPQRLQAHTALHEQGTIFEVSLIILSAPTDVYDLMRRASLTVVERHRYGHFSIYLAQPDSGDLRLAGGEPTGVFPKDAALSLAEKAAARSSSIQERSGGAWQVAVPIASDSSTLGAIVAGSDEPGIAANHALALCRELAAQLALGIQNTNLRRRQIELAADYAAATCQCPSRYGRESIASFTRRCRTFSSTPVRPRLHRARSGFAQRAYVGEGQRRRIRRGKAKSRLRAGRHETQG